MVTIPILINIDYNSSFILFIQILALLQMAILPFTKKMELMIKFTCF